MSYVNKLDAPRSGDIGSEVYHEGHRRKEENGDEMS